MLAVGPYPEKLKRRVAGPYGHLANDQTGQLAARLAGSRLAHMYLGHISRANNTPERALEVVCAAARRAGRSSVGVSVVPHGVPQRLGLPRRAAQLALPFSN
jgi:hypothetical protein